MGMDVRVRESGQWRGRRKLTKKGDPEIRRQAAEMLELTLEPGLLLRRQ